MKKVFYRIISLLLVFSILSCNNISSFVYAENSKYNYFVSYSGEKISEKDIINALLNSNNIQLYSNTSSEQNDFSLKAIDNKLNNVPNYSFRAAPVVYAIYTIVVLGVTYTITILNNGDVLIKAGEAVIDAASSVGRAVMNAAKGIIDKANDELKHFNYNHSLKKAVTDCDKNKQHHILQDKHNWNKLFGGPNGPSWNAITPVILEVLKKGSEKYEGNGVYLRTLVYKGVTVSVRFIKDSNGAVVALSTAWCK